MISIFLSTLIVLFALLSRGDKTDFQAPQLGAVVIISPGEAYLEQALTHSVGDKYADQQDGLVWNKLRCQLPGYLCCSVSLILCIYVHLLSSADLGLT